MRRSRKELPQFLSTLSLRRATARILLDLTFHKNFYPRSPCGERRITDGSICFDSNISIHALLAESDNSMTHMQRFCAYFYPRSPCGERQLIGMFNRPDGQFLSTLSLRRATLQPGYCALIHSFLSTLSLRRATSMGLDGRFKL